MKKVLAMAAGLMLLGSGCQLLNFKPKADPFYGAVLDRYPSNPAVVYLQAQETLNQGQYSAALKQFQNYSGLTPSDVRGWLGVGQCELELHAFSNAEAAFRHAETISATPAGAAGLASAILMQGRAAESKAVLDNASVAFGENASVIRVQGDVALAQNNPSDALKNYQSSLALNSVQPELRKRIQDLRDYLTSQR